MIALLHFSVVHTSYFITHHPALSMSQLGESSPSGLIQKPGDAMPAAGPAVDESNGPLSGSPVSLPTVSPATKPESGLPTLFELYKLASERQARLNPPTEQPEDSSSESDDTSGSESDEDAADFASCRALNIRPDSFHEKGGVPTFRPTMEQFRDFEGFIRAVEPWGKRRGLVKVIRTSEGSCETVY